MVARQPVVTTGAPVVIVFHLLRVAAPDDHQVRLQRGTAAPTATREGLDVLERARRAGRAEIRKRAGTVFVKLLPVVGEGRVVRGELAMEQRLHAVVVLLKI